jgi:hypothetical protein
MITVPDGLISLEKDGFRWAPTIGQICIDNAIVKLYGQVVMCIVQIHVTFD